jgi:hypothetical protein
MTSSRRRHALLLAFSLAVPVLAPSRALAQPAPPTAQELETARSLYKQGKELRAQGDLRGAIEKLEAAHALGNTPVTGIELARTYVLVARFVEAREVCLYIARMPVAGDETEKSVEARGDAMKLAEELRPRIPTLAVHVAGLAPGERAHLTIDGASIPDLARGEAQKVNPGHHEVALRVGEGAAAREVRATSEIIEGQAAEVTLTVPPAPAVMAPPPEARSPRPPPHAPFPSTVLVRAGFATAIAGGAIGILAGVTAINKKNQLASECDATTGGCPASTGGQADLATARTWATVSTVSFVVASAGVIAGVVGLLTGKRADGNADQASVAPWLGAGAAGVHGRF